MKASEQGFAHLGLPDANNPRVSDIFFSILPPDHNWHVIKPFRSQTNVGYGVYMDSGPYDKPLVDFSFRTTVFAVPAGQSELEFYDYVEGNSFNEILKQNLQLGVATLVKNEIAAYTKLNARCLLRHTVTSSKTWTPEGRVPSMNENKSLLCVLPTDGSPAEVGIIVTYEHLYEIGHRDSEFDENSRKVFESMVIN
jgi:hypothetical protein